MTSSPTAVGHRVQVSNAAKRYGTTAALAGVNFDVEPGQFLVLLGPSGSGKSTLIRSLAGIERLDTGQVRLSGKLVADGNRHLSPERRDLAMVFQDYALWPHLTVLGNVSYALRRRRLEASVARSRVHAALERVGLGLHAARYPHELSGGEQQRVALARAVVAEPQLLLFDEPLSNLDADLRERLRVEIATVTRESGATAIYITHDQAEAFALADKIGVLDHGNLLQLAGPEDIYRRPATPFVARFTGVAGELEGQAVQVAKPYVHVRLDDGVLLRVGCIGLVNAGDAVRVLVRPAATRIAVDPPDQSVDTSRNQLHGVVTDVAYRGRGYDHVVMVGEANLTAVYDNEAHPRGTLVTVVLDPEHCLAFTDTTASTSVGYTNELTTVTIPTSSAQQTPDLARRAS